MLIESVLALEVGAAASRIFSSAIWEDRSAQVRAQPGGVVLRRAPGAGHSGGAEALAGQAGA